MKNTEQINNEIKIIIKVFIPMTSVGTPLASTSNRQPTTNELLSATPSRNWPPPQTKFFCTVPTLLPFSGALLTAPPSPTENMTFCDAVQCPSGVSKLEPYGGSVTHTSTPNAVAR